MPAYFVIDMTFPDAETPKQYEAGANPLLNKHGARILVRATEADYDVVEGDWRPQRLVICEFPDRQSIHAFYDDPDFAPLKALRQAVPGQRAEALAVEGN